MQTLQNIFYLFSSRSLILRMSYKEITDRYAGSALGIFWAVIQPLFLIALYTFVFTFVFKIRVSTDDSPIKYAFYAIAGLIPWICMAECMSKSITSISQKSALVKQAIFPTEILPVSTTIANFTSLIVGFSIYLILAAFFLHGAITWLVLLLPLVILINFIFTLGVAYFLAIGGVYFKDFVELIGVILTVGMFVTPILYIEGSIPVPLQFLMNFNLAAHIIYMYRDILYYGQFNHPWSFLIFTLAAIIIFIFGNRAFYKMKHFFANVL